MRTLAVVLVFSVAAVAAELPVRQVVLYKNGVGYFERAGEVKAGETALLAFKQSEMNDILKSLTIRDSAGNAVTGLRYDSAEPIQSKLATFPFETNDEKTLLSTFLNRLRGARILAANGTEKISGTIILARQIAATDRQPEREQLLLLVDSGDMRTVDLGAISGLQLADPALQTRLRDYLRILGQSISADKRIVTIESANQAVRSLTASYMVPAPIWKSSYRLLFGASGEPMLEGWGIVDNTSGEDWNGVRLALVSGRPISFISNLFETRNIERRVADLPELAAMNPVLYEGGVMGGVMGGILGGVPGGPPPPPPPAAAPPPRQNYARSQAVMTSSSIDVNSTAGREIADLFEYSFAQPVTIRAGESAMLPFVQQKIGARKLLIYSDRSSRNPVSAVELTNTTDKTLDGGPVTVFESASYAGEALMETLKASDRRLIGYAVDLGTRVGTKLDSGAQEIREIHLRRGLLTVRGAQHWTQTYTIRNIDKRPKTLIVEHPIRSDFKLIGAKPIETTTNAYRFEVKLEADAEQSFPVTEEQIYQSSTTISSAAPSLLASYIEGRALSAEGRKAIVQISALRQNVDDLRRETRTVESSIQAFERDSERTRQNIRSLNDVAGQSDQVQRYARQLGEFETRLAGLRDRQTELANKTAALELQLNSVIDSTEF